MGIYEDPFFGIFSLDKLPPFDNLFLIDVFYDIKSCSHFVLMSTLCLRMYRWRFREVRIASLISSYPLKISDSKRNFMYFDSFSFLISSPLNEGVLVLSEFYSLPGLDIDSMLELWVKPEGLKKSEGSLDFLIGSLQILL